MREMEGPSVKKIGCMDRRPELSHRCSTLYTAVLSKQKSPSVPHVNTAWLNGPPGCLRAEWLRHPVPRSPIDPSSFHFESSGTLKCFSLSKAWTLQSPHPYAESIVRLGEERRCQDWD